jgi:hypothetical protein
MNSLSGTRAAGATPDQHVELGRDVREMSFPTPRADGNFNVVKTTINTPPGYVVCCPVSNTCPVANHFRQVKPEDAEVLVVNRWIRYVHHRDQRRYYSHGGQDDVYRPVSSRSGSER